MDSGHATAGWIERWRSAILAVACLFAILPGLATLPPVDRDEARYVQATKQMLETGDYVDIRFQDEHRYKKPVGIYWLQVAAVKLTGQGSDADIWAYRLVSVASGIVAVLMIASLGTYMFGPVAGFGAGLMLIGIFGLGFEARLAKTDATLLAITLVTQAALARFYFAPRRGEVLQAHWWWIFWLGIGAGLLVKGPVTPAVTLLTLAFVAWFDPDRAWLKSLKPLRGILLALIVVLPWFISITMRSGGDFWAESVGRDFLGKLTSGQESHGAPPGYYVLTYGLYMWPFGLLAVIGGLKALNRFRDPRFLFCLGWYIPFWLLIEAIPTKLPHYPLPAYPGLLLLAAWAYFTVEGRAVELKTWQRWIVGLTALGLVVVTAAFGLGALAGPSLAMGQFPLVGIPVALAAFVAGWLASGWGRPENGLGRIAGASAAAAIFMGLVAGQLMPYLTPMWMSPEIVRLYEKNKPCKQSPLASVTYHEPSLVFLAGTDTQLTDTNGAAAVLANPDGCGVAVLPEEHWAAVEALMPDNISLESVGRIEGTNYSKGQELNLVMLRQASGTQD